MPPGVPDQGWLETTHFTRLVRGGEAGASCQNSRRVLNQQATPGKGIPRSIL